LEKQPTWSALTDEPQLSVQQACSLAYSNINSRFKEVREWRIQTVYLRNLASGGTSGNVYSCPKVWIYEVTYEPAAEMMRELKEDVDLGALTQVVLLDGTVVPSKEKGTNH
jgi:hypothetical protein